jgi:hypothetical protein
MLPQTSKATHQISPLTGYLGKQAFDSRVIGGERVARRRRFLLRRNLNTPTFGSREYTAEPQDASSMVRTPEAD